MRQLEAPSCFSGGRPRFRDACVEPRSLRLELYQGLQQKEAAAILACRPGSQGWLDGPDNWDGSLGGRGFAPTPNPEPTPMGGGYRAVVRCNGYIYMCVCVIFVVYCPFSMFP